MVTGTTTEDEVLTADTSGIADADGLGAQLPVAALERWRHELEQRGSDAAT
ncbi:MAG: hypothetical protein H6949_11775 [Zoogloeaceae bacterium]|nr:hypothetical protein [Zoogloeaceae bacterium]